MLVCNVGEGDDPAYIKGSMRDSDKGRDMYVLFNCKHLASKSSEELAGSALC